MNNVNDLEERLARLDRICETDSDDDELFELLKEVVEEEKRNEAESSRSHEKRSRNYIRRDREAAGDRLMEDYFADTPKYPGSYFKRRFRMRRQLFLQIVEGITSYSVEPIPEHFLYFRQRPDALGRMGFTPIQKCTSAIRQLAYGTSPDMFDEYLQMADRTSRDCLNNFCKCIYDLYSAEYLRRPTAQDIERLYRAHEQKHGFVGMLGSIDCMHWPWKNCPIAWQGQFTRGDQGTATIMLEAVASYDMWIWHAFFGMAGSNNDINVLNASPLFDDLKNDTGPPCPFDVNGNHYTKGYYLADGIYPDWVTLMKGYSCPTDEKRKKFTHFQESARKDVERTFGVLQGRWGIIKAPARAMSMNKIRRTMYTCVILHNMIQQDQGFAITPLEEEFLRDPANLVRRGFRERVAGRAARIKELRDRDVHNQLREDLAEHIWTLPATIRAHRAPPAPMEE